MAFYERPCNRNCFANQKTGTCACLSTVTKDCNFFKTPQEFAEGLKKYPDDYIPVNVKTAVAAKEEEKKDVRDGCKDCFALNKITGKCDVLTRMDKDCNFYKTKKEFDTAANAPKKHIVNVIRVTSGVMWYGRKGGGH